MAWERIFSGQNVSSVRFPWRRPGAGGRQLQTYFNGKGKMQGENTCKNARAAAVPVRSDGAGNGGVDGADVSDGGNQSS